MKIVAIICNIVLFGFTCFVLITDGPGQQAAYIVFGQLLVWVPILSVVVLLRGGARATSPGPQTGQSATNERGKTGNAPSPATAIRRVTIIGNMALFGFACWAIASQYPHPEEEGLIPFTVLVLLTPVLNVLALSRGGGTDGRFGLQKESEA